MLKVSVIIPARNDAAYLEECLLALRRQTLQPLEVIVVDNASRDGTADLARQLGARVLVEPRIGIVFARNRGFNAARGDVIARIDADTVVPPTWVATISRVMDEPTITAVSGPALFYDVPLPRLFSWLYAQIVFGFNNLLLGHAILWGSNTALRRSAWRAVATKAAASNAYHEDLDLSALLAQHGYRVKYLPSLSVLASMRRLYSPRPVFASYIRKWYATLQHHGYATLGLDRLVGTIISLAQPLVSRACYGYLGIKYRWRRWFESLRRFAQ